MSYLGKLIIFLLNEVNHPQKLVRAISCWTLSKFAKFVLIDNTEDDSQELIKVYLSEVLKRLLDSESIVQDSACSAFMTILETNSTRVENYITDIIGVPC